MEAATLRISCRRGGKVQLVVIKYWFISLLTVRKKSCAALPLCLFLRSTHDAGTFLGTFTHRAVEAQLVILGGRERGVSSPWSSPGEVSSRQPWVPVQLLPLSGGGQRVRDEAPCDTELSAGVWLCLLGGTLKTVWLLMCAYEIYLCRLSLRARLCFSRFNIHLLRVNTVATFSWEADTRNLSVSL